MASSIHKPETFFNQTTPLTLMIEARFMFKMLFTDIKKNNIKTLTTGSKTNKHSSLQSESKKKFYFYSQYILKTMCLIIYS